MEAKIISTVNNYLCSSSIPNRPRIGILWKQQVLPVQDQKILAKDQILKSGQLKRMKWRAAKEEGGVGAVSSENVFVRMDEEEELIGMMKLSEKCRGVGGGIVELLECLEREAIMGEDEGRDPTDYNRRALIFDKSSRVFQKLKEQQISSSAE